MDAAEKKNKHDAIELFNGDLIDGRIKILKGSVLEQQLMNLQWAVDERTGLLREDKGARNDMSDAAIYARRRAAHKFAAEVVPEPEPTAVEKRRGAMAPPERPVNPATQDNEFSSWLSDEGYYEEW